jgi:hypothetical protein
MNFMNAIVHLRARGYKVTKVYLKSRPSRRLKTTSVDFEIDPELCEQYHTDYIIETEGPKKRKSRAKRAA